MNMSEAHEYINRIREKAEELNVAVTFDQDRKVFIHNSTGGSPAYSRYFDSDD